MHNIDRTLMEMDPEAEYEPELESDYEYDEFEAPDTEAVFDEASRWRWLRNCSPSRTRRSSISYWAAGSRRPGGPSVSL